MKCFAVAVLLALGGCASSSSPTNRDGGGGLSICPTHPEQCGGKCCGDKCVDVTADPNNCGDCNLQCDTGQLCQGGHCGCLPTGAMCGQAQTCCNAVGCKSLMSDANNCGQCGKSCGPGGTCTNGQCTCGSMTCAANQVCCSGTCSTTCVTDMGQPLDLTTSGGTCQCTNGCMDDPIAPICFGPGCCYTDFLFGLCNSDPGCQPG